MDSELIREWEATEAVVEDFVKKVLSASKAKAVREAVEEFDEDWKRQVDDLRHEYHGCNYETGYNDGMEEYTIPPEVGEAIEEHCLQCDDRKGCTIGGGACDLKGCRFLPVLREAVKAEMVYCH